MTKDYIVTHAIKIDFDKILEMYEGFDSVEDCEFIIGLYLDDLDMLCGLLNIIQDNRKELARELYNYVHSKNN